MIKLLYHDSFWECFIARKNLQGQIRTFMNKFKENPKNPSLHLEPISTFKDKKLRTARVTQQYRAILSTTELPDTYYLLWVDNHDEAMDWAKDKCFEWNVETQSVQLFDAPEEPKESATKQVQDGLFAAYSDKDLQKIGAPSLLLSTIRQIKDLNDLDKLSGSISEDLYENLFTLEDTGDLDAIITEIKAGKVDSEDLAEQMQSLNNRRFAFEVNDEELEEMLEGGLEKWKYYLHPKQRKIIEKDYKGSTKVSGSAGTGKTVCALHRLKYLCEKGPLEKPILFTTYTKSLIAELQKLVKGMGLLPSQVLTSHIDQICVALAEKEGLLANRRLLDYDKTQNSIDLWREVTDTSPTKLDAEFLQSEYQDVIQYHNIKEAKEYYRVSRIGRGVRLSRKAKMEIWGLKEAFEGLKLQKGFVDRSELFNLMTDHFQSMEEKPFSHVVADELQDLSNIQLRFLRSLVEEKPNDLFLVGDPFQNIFDRRISLYKAGINIRGAKSRRLTINYRTSEQIRRVAVSVIKGEDYDDFDGETEERSGYVSLFRGEQPKYQLFKGEDEQQAFILDEIESLLGQFAASEIAIACFRTKALDAYVDLLHKQKIPYFKIHESSSRGDKQGIRLSTFHSLKGLEFKALFLANVNSGTLPIRPSAFAHWEPKKQKSFLRSQRSLFYVAASRAIHYLSISGCGRGSDFLQLKSN